jgi:hypothetical protein
MTGLVVISPIKYVVEIPIDNYSTRHPKAVYAAYEVLLHGKTSLYLDAQRILSKRDFIECEGPARELDINSYIQVIQAVVEKKLRNKVA